MIAISNKTTQYTVKNDQVISYSDFKLQENANSAVSQQYLRSVLGVCQVCFSTSEQEIDEKYAHI